MLVEKIVAYESGELDEENTLELFAELIKTGMAWKLQGSYGRTANRFIEAGCLSETGEIL